MENYMTKVVSDVECCEFRGCVVNSRKDGGLRAVTNGVTAKKVCSSCASYFLKNGWKPEGWTPPQTVSEKKKDMPRKNRDEDEDRKRPVVRE
jgi:hypothetical protein